MRRKVDVELILRLYLVAADKKDEYSELCLIFAWALYLQISLLCPSDDGWFSAEMENMCITARLMLRWIINKLDVYLIISKAYFIFEEFSIKEPFLQANILSYLKILRAIIPSQRKSVTFAMKVYSWIKFLEDWFFWSRLLLRQKIEVFSNLNIEYTFLYLLESLRSRIDETFLLGSRKFSKPSLDDYGCSLNLKQHFEVILILFAEGKASPYLLYLCHCANFLQRVFGKEIYPFFSVIWSYKPACIKKVNSSDNVLQ